MIDKTILHYKIIEKLGAGGMGIVYLAEDLKLERKVAIKFLPYHISNDWEEKARFKIEAKAAASLNHPNITTIYSIEENEENIFIVMEYIEGKELKDIINPPSSPLSKRGDSGGLPLNDIINYSIQIASGLEESHKKGVIHRDIKSQNIIITDDDKIKIMDFGLARIGNGQKLTQIGSTIGTIAYMSPEQTRGEEIDYRTDIWSFGVVLYEMLARKLPFRGDYDQAVIYSILNEKSNLLNEVEKDIPSQIIHIVEKCLEKNPADRFQSAKELKEELRAIEKSFQHTQNKKISYIIAVMPFTNIRNDSETDFLGFALADQVIGSLSYLKNILVRPSSSIRKYQNQTFDPQTIGADLKVNIILTGNYLKENNNIRLNIELVDVNANEMIWREPIKVKYEDTFTLQDIVSEKVINRLKVQFSEDERGLMQGNVSQDPIAYEYYLRGISYPSTTEGDLAAIDILNKSIQLDSNYAPAFSELGFRRQRNGNYGLAGNKEIKKAEEAFRHALSLNGNLLDALWNLATLYTETGRIEKAVELVRKMLTINPNNAAAHFSLGYIYRYTGMLYESEKEFDLALAIDPLNQRFRSAGVTYRCLKKYEKAVRAYNLDKGSSFTLLETAFVFYLQGKNKESIKMWNTLLDQESDSWFFLFGKAMKAAIEDDFETAKKALNDLEKLNPSDPELWFMIGEIYSKIGEAKSSVRTLEEAVNRGYYNYTYMVENSFFDPISDTPDFIRILEMVKVKHDRFKERIFPTSKG